MFKSEKQRRRSSSSCTEESTSSDGKGKHERGSELRPRTFWIPSHGDNVVKDLNQQRLCGEFCDITVLVEHQRFSAHKCVLAANSPYFKSLLSADNDGVFLRHITAESFRAVLHFMYTSKLQLEAKNVQDILSAAKFLQIKGIVSICCRYLESQIRNLANNYDANKKGENPVMTSPPVNAEQIFQSPRNAQFAYNNPMFVQEPMMTSNGLNDVMQPQIMTFPPGRPLETPVAYNPQPMTSQYLPRFANYNKPNNVRKSFQPGQFNPGGVNAQQWNNPDYTPSFFPYAGPVPGRRAPNMSQHAPAQHRAVPVNLGPVKAAPGKNFKTMSTGGGKGRRGAPQPRRKASTHEAASSNYVPSRYRHR